VRGGGDGGVYCLVNVRECVVFVSNGEEEDDEECSVMLAFSVVGVCVSCLFSSRCCLCCLLFLLDSFWCVVRLCC